MSRYEGLSDIDLECPEYFETSDVESDASGASASAEAEPPTETETVTPEQARLAFENSLVDGCQTDFSDSLAAANASYRGVRILETPHQRLLRIRRELHELEMDKETGPELMDDVKGLRSVVETLSRQPDVPPLRLPFTPEELPTRETALASGAWFGPGPRPIITLETLAAFETRLALMEEVVGYDLLHDSHTSIQAAINDLTRKVKMLGMKAEGEDDPLQAIAARFAELNQKSDTLHARKHTPEMLAEPDAEASKVAELYRMVKESTLSENAIRGVINRLQTLHEMHGQIADSLLLCNSLDDMMGGIQDGIADWSKGLNTMEAKLEEEEKRWASAQAEIRQSIEALEKRVG